MRLSGISIFCAASAVFFSPVSAAWVRANAGSVDTNITPLVKSGTAIYAGGYKGIHRSNDSGATWTQVKPAGSNPGVTNVIALAVDGSRIFAGTLFDGLHISLDGGQSWKKPATVLRSGSIEAVIVSGGLVYAGSGSAGGSKGTGFYVSLDSGATFTAANTGLTDLNVAVLLVDGEDLYAGTAGGLFVSGNRGGAWKRIDSGMYSKKISALAKMEGTLFAGTESGGAVYASTDKGVKWTLVGSATLPETQPVSVLIQKGPHLFAATGGNGFFASADQGKTWKNFSDGITRKNVMGILIVGEKILISTTEYGGVDGEGILSRPLAEVTEVPTGLPPRAGLEGIRSSHGTRTDANGRAIRKAGSSFGYPRPVP